MKRGTPVTVTFPDGIKRHGWYVRAGANVWHRISSGISKGKPSIAGWWCVARKQDQVPYFL